MPAYMEKTYGVRFSRGPLRQGLPPRGFSGTRPTDVLKQARPADPAAFREEGATLKNLAPDPVLLLEDESPIRDDQAIGAPGFRRGQQKPVPTYGHHARVALLGAGDVLGDPGAVQETADRTAHTFPGFLAGWLARFPDQQLVLI